VGSGTLTAEQRARENIDRLLSDAGWVIQNRDEANLYAAQGVAVREFRMKSGHGSADYMLFVDRKAVGVAEAKPEGHTLTGVERQSAKYSEGLPPQLETRLRPLPFLYQSTGIETRFTNLLDPEPRSRPVFSFHKPSTLAEWLEFATLAEWLARAGRVADVPLPESGTAATPSTFRARLRTMPRLDIPDLWPNQRRAIMNLERSLTEARPRALIQMATGSGKTLLAIHSIYRLAKFAGARRILFLVDRDNLGKQARTEFESFRSPDDQRKLTELYGIQHLTSNTIAGSSKVVISTIQRLYSMLKGEADLDPELESSTNPDSTIDLRRDPVPVSYNPAIPPEFFDIIFIDECHRSIYTLWRQVLEYFDAFLIGLTATPAKHTYGFFNKNLVMEYTHEEAVADKVNVDFDVYRIRTRITEQGSTIEASPLPIVGMRARKSRRIRWEAPDHDITYSGSELDRNVVAKDQIRTVVRAFRDKVLTEIFPGRTNVPKTLIYAKDDSHAEDIVEIVREEFGKGNDFCTKITYKVTGRDPDDLIQEFRTSFNPRIAVTVDMIATGTDIKPVEIVMFMRTVKSRVLFEQMKGRGVRVVDADDLRGVTPDALAKTHFVIVDCVGATETKLMDTRPLERNRGVSFAALLEHVAFGGTNQEYVSSLASRLARLDQQCGPEEQKQIEAASGGLPLRSMVRNLIEAIDPDEQIARARIAAGIPDDQEPSQEQVAAAAGEMIRDAAAPLASNPKLRKTLQDVKTALEQILDEVSTDEILGSGFSEEARERAQSIVKSFEEFLRENKDEITALQFFYSRPYRERLHYDDIKALADTIKAPPRSWTTEQLWRAYETLDRSRVRGASAQRLLTDLVSLVRFALNQETELVPFAENVRSRYESWIAQQETAGRHFNDDQRLWLAMIRDHIAASVEVTLDDFELTPFVDQGGLGRARQVFGANLSAVLKEMNEVLAA
jgi:type I restriction enzyme R subunit